MTENNFFDSGGYLVEVFLYLFDSVLRLICQDQRLLMWTTITKIWKASKTKHWKIFRKYKKPLCSWTRYGWQLVSLDTGCKLNLNKTFRRHAGRVLNVFCTFNLHPMSRGMRKICEKILWENSMLKRAWPKKYLANEPVVWCQFECILTYGIHFTANRVEIKLCIML